MSAKQVCLEQNLLGSRGCAQDAFPGDVPQTRAVGAHLSVGRNLRSTLLQPGVLKSRSPDAGIAASACAWYAAAGELAAAVAAGTEERWGEREERRWWWFRGWVLAQARVRAGDMKGGSRVREYENVTRLAGFVCTLFARGSGQVRQTFAPDQPIRRSQRQTVDGRCALCVRKAGERACSRSSCTAHRVRQFSLIATG